MDAGDIWYRSLSETGDNIGKAIEAYHQRHQQFTDTMSMLDLMHQTTLPTGHRGKPQQILDDKNYEALSHYLQVHRDSAAAVQNELIGVYQNLAMQGAKARFQANQISPWIDAQGNQVGVINHRTGAVHPYAKTATGTQSPTGDAFLKKTADAMLRKMQITPEEFMARGDEKLGYADPNNPDETFSNQKDRSKYPDNATQFTINGKPRVVGQPGFETLRRIYPREGEKEFTQMHSTGPLSRDFGSVQRAREALKWVKSHPSDPVAERIKEKALRALGIKPTTKPPGVS